MEPIVYILIIFGVFVAIGVWGVISRKVNDANLELRMKYKFGEPPMKEYMNFDSLSHYYEMTSDGKFAIDDITWNDLDMDRIYTKIDNTESSAGEEYLYKMLRVPCFSKEELDERERVFSYMDSHERERIDLQKIFCSLGKTKYISLWDYLDNFMELKMKDRKMHIFCLCFFFFSIAVFFANTSIGVFLFITAIIFNSVKYFTTKSDMGVYMISIAYISRLVKCAERIGKRKDAELSEYEKELKELAAPLSVIQKKAKLIGSDSQYSGDLFSTMLQYLNMATHLDLIMFGQIYDLVKGHVKEIERMLELVGFLDASISVASYRKLLPYYCRPEYTDKPSGGENYLDAKELYHPMIKDAVANSIEESRCVLLTGSNASGKSTFLKTVAIASLFGQSINTVCAKEYRSRFYKTMSSMSLKDNLEMKESYYMVEIKSLKRIMDMDQSDHPVLCFVDEVLRGTNTVERIAASSQILYSLSESGTMCFAATHDIELTHLLEKVYSNYHFREEVEDDDVLFNYVLNKGRATTRNAIRLLSIMGYKENVIEKAENMAEDFIESGEWKMKA